MPEPSDELQRGRAAYARSAWGDADELLSQADRAARLEAADLELLATAAYMLGRDEDHVRVLERAHHEHLSRGDELRATHCACWMGINLSLRGELARASGWFGRAHRLLEAADSDSVERGYLMLPAMMQQQHRGEFDAAFETAEGAREIGRRFGDADLITLAIHVQGRARVKQGRIEEGLSLLDEAMVAVTAGELSPIATGIVYCSVIEGCQEVFELGRAREWTEALARWCDGQTDLVSFTGKCLMHRAEIMQAHGEWPDALAEARRACERHGDSHNDGALAQATYRQGEILRLQGRLDEAEAAYARATHGGWEPQPGLALLRLAKGDTSAAVAAIRRVLGETSDLLTRAGLLPACVEIMLAAGDIEEARRASLELEQLETESGSGMLAAMVATARGAVMLKDGDAWAALNALRHAGRLWQQLQAPYEGARVRMLVARACRAVDDDDAADMELEAARAALERLGAATDLALAERLSQPAVSRDTHGEDTHGLTPRELEVLRLIARGDTNRAIAEELVISERTVDRHVSNILAKLRVPSRAAATAYAYENALV